MTPSARKRRLRSSAALWLVTLLFLVLANRAEAQVLPCAGSITGGSGFSGFGNNAFYALTARGSGTLNLILTTEFPCTWRIALNQTWATVSPTSGTISWRLTIHFGQR